MIWRAFLFPRYRLTSLPTPLTTSNSLGKSLGVKLFFKRDDVMELVFGGNKVRKLEYFFGDLLSKGCDVVITRGAYHSNHARLTVAAARKAGIDAYLVLYPPGEKVFQGNLLLDQLLGANIRFIDDPGKADDVMKEIAVELEKKGRKPYIIPVGGASPLGVLGYVTASLEIVQQLHELNHKPDYIVIASGTGATQAGLVLGLKMLGLDTRVIGISVGRRASELTRRILDLIEETKRLLKVDTRVSEEDIIVYDKYSFGGYSSTPRKLIEFIIDASRKEAMIFDPVYTGKALYGLVDLVENHEVRENSVVVFIHTGGTPIVFQMSRVIEEYLGGFNK